MHQAKINILCKKNTSTNEITAQQQRNKKFVEKFTTASVHNFTTLRRLKK